MRGNLHKSGLEMKEILGETHTQKMAVFIYVYILRGENRSCMVQPIQKKKKETFSLDAVGYSDIE
jgi:hypothetical protein